MKYMKKASRACCNNSLHIVSCDSIVILVCVYLIPNSSISSEVEALNEKNRLLDEAEIKDAVSIYKNVIVFSSKCKVI